MFSFDIAIPTHNRSAELAKTLESLRRLRSPNNVKWRILVIDNNCTDDTNSVLDRFSLQFGERLCHVFEKKPGLCYARNAAVSASQADVIAFLDDDVDVEPQWLEAMLRAFDEEKCDVVGGRAELLFPCERPEWIGELEQIHLSRVYLNDGRIPCGADDIFGLNLAIRTEWFSRVGLFRTDLDRVGSCLLGGGETELLRRIVSGGGHLVYEPQALVWHRIPAERMKKSWFVRRQYWGARSSLRADGIGAFDASRILIGAGIRLLTSCASFTWRAMSKGMHSVEAFRRRRWIAAARGEIDESLFTLFGNRS